MKYRCVKQIVLPKVDKDGFSIENESYTTEIGSIWYDNEEDYRLVGGEVRLELQGALEWIEITKDDLEECFEQIK